MNNAYNIYYDMQRNSFYRINKQTGETNRSYLNGQNLPSFKPHITGFEYHLRKKSTIDYGTHSRKLSSVTQSILSSYSPRSNSKKLQKVNKPYQNNNSVTSRSKQSMYNTINLRQKQRSTSQFTFQPNSTKYLHQTIRSKSKQKQSEDQQKESKKYIGDSTLTSSERQTNDFRQTGGEQTFMEKAKNYQRILNNKIKENHSPLKDKDGSVQRKDILDELCVTKSIFRKNDKYIDKQKVLPKSTAKQQKQQTKESKFKNTLQLYSVQKQIKSQRNSGFKILEDLKEQRSKKNLQRDKIRNKNLKLLQKQMLRKNQKRQTQIFNSGAQ